MPTSRAPAKDKRPPAPAKGPEAKARRAGTREAKPLVLVVDDQPAPRLLTVLALRETALADSYEVAEAQGGKDGIAKINEAFDQNRPVFVLCDLRMPPPDGLAVLGACHGRAPAPFRFVLYTVEAPPESERRAFELGADDVVTRMLEPKAFAERLGGRLERWLRASTAPTMPPRGA